MTKINTLGPKLTDSYRAARSLGIKSDEICLYDSFDELITHMKEMRDQYILIPTAYENTSGNYSWKDFNFDYWENLRIVKVFHEKTKPMVLIEHSKFEQNIASIQPATKIMLTRYLERKKLSVKVKYLSSKVKAYQEFFENKYRFTIVSSDVVKSSDDVVVRKIYNPEMVWCLYEVIGVEND